MRICLMLLLVLGLAGAGAYLFLSGPKHAPSANAAEEQNKDAEDETILVRAVKPHKDKAFSMVERRPADVQPYYRSDLESRVPGVVSMIRTDVGDIVKKGEPLIKVEVPDLEARAAQQEANWHLAQAQVEQKSAAIKTAKADVVAAAAKIRSTTAKLKSDVAYHKFRTIQAKRYHELLAKSAIDARLVDEEEDRLEAAFEAVNASTEAVETAKAQETAAAARVEQAEADLKEATEKVKVTKAEWDFAKAMLEYATIRAPYDGMIAHRSVDPGFFVQNAGNGHATPLVPIERTDIVTVVMRLPDIYASYVTPETEAIFETPELPGIKIRGKVTRFPKSLVNAAHDRTMPVEIDLWNGSSEEEYKQKMADPKFTSQLKKGMPGDPRNGLPILPEIKGKLIGGRQKRMMPGMFGEMTLLLRTFDDAQMLPSSAIVIEGGNSYIYVVQDGKAHMQPVKVQVDDGKLVKVERLDSNGDVLGDLTGKEEVIISNQSELSEGQPVKATVINDWRSLEDKVQKD